MAKKKRPQPPWMRVFRRNLRKVRRRLNVSQRELAARVGMFPQALSNIERGERGGIVYDTALRLAEGLGVDLAVLMETKGKTVMERPGDAKRIPDETIVETEPEAEGE